jgi:hypothetical protein
MKLELIPFYGDHITTLFDEKNNVVYVPFKRIVETIGLDWKTQFKKVKEQDKLYKAVVITHSSLDGGKAVCLRVDKLYGWLIRVNSNRVRDDLQDKLSHYQEECFDAINDYWTKGRAINPRANTADISNLDLSSIMSNKDSVNQMIDALFNNGDIVAVAKYIKNLSDAFYKSTIELQKKRQIIDIMFNGRKGVWPLVQIHKSLNVFDNNGNSVPPRIGFQILTDKGIFCKTKDVPYAKYDNKEYFSKAEVPIVGKLGVWEYIEYLQDEGYIVHHPKNQKLLPPMKQIRKQMEEGQKGITMKEERLKGLEPISEEKQEDSLLEKMKSKPMMTPPFQNQSDNCETNIPEGSTIH